MTNTERFLEGFGEPIKSSRIFPESVYSLDIWLQLKQLVKRISFSPKYTYRTILYCSTIKTTEKYIVLSKFVLISHTSGLTTQTIRYDNLLTPLQESMAYQLSFDSNTLGLYRELEPHLLQHNGQYHRKERSFHNTQRISTTLENHKLETRLVQNERKYHRKT